MKNKLVILALLLPIISLAQENHFNIIEYDPDTCYTFHYSYDTLKYDLDNDGIADIIFKAAWESTVGNIAVITTPSPNWQWSWTYASEFTPLTDTTLINGYLRWENGSWELAMYPEFTHFAFRHLTADGYCYGWAHIYVESLARVCVDCMAYCDCVNYPLRWGQTTMTGIEESDKSNSFASIHPNPTTGQITILGENLRQAEVLNMLGQQVLSVQGEGNELRIDMAALPAGVYFVNVTDEDGRKCVRKVVKE